MTRGDEIVRGESLAALFARGDLDEVLARHLRRPARGPADRAAVVGAYAWSGRLDEARAQHASFAASPGGDDPAYLEVARCWLIIGLCHAGRLGAARALWRSGGARDGFHPRYARAFIAYFAGRMERCRRAARKALRLAVTDGDAFGQLLANDLLAHAMFHLGRAREGQRLLASATHLSAELNLEANYLNVMVASQVFAVTTRPGDGEAVAALVALLRHRELRYFARRHGHAALSIAACLRGELAEARAQREQAAAVGGDDPRAAVRQATARACLAAVSGERAAAAAAFDEALRLAAAPRSRGDLDRACAIEGGGALPAPAVGRGRSPRGIDVHAAAAHARRARATRPRAQPPREAGEVGGPGHAATGRSTMPSASAVCATRARLSARCTW